MPSRWFCAAIVAFWLFTNGWLLWRELLPSWEPNQPPPMMVDLVDEVHLQGVIKIPWTVAVYSPVRKKWERAYHAGIWVEHGPEKDLFDLKLELAALPRTAGGEVDPAMLAIRKMESATRVTAAGELRELAASGSGTRSGISYSFQLKGQVRSGVFSGNYTMRLPPLPPLTREFPPTRVNYQGTVMLGIHPVQRLRGLRPGQTWQVPTLEFGLSSVSVSHVRARVLPELEILPWRHRDRTCQVIESEDNEEHTRTWVEVETGRVLKQETTFMQEHWLMERERE
jgi:hypothetical protein